MDCYHGTLNTTARTLATGRIKVTFGGGELGVGFYAGDYLWVAKAWAANRHGVSSAVLKLQLADADFYRLDPLLLSRTDAVGRRDHIRRTGGTRTFVFNENVVWSPIVGTTRVDADQYKFESVTSESLLNGPNVTRTLV